MTQPFNWTDFLAGLAAVIGPGGVLAIVASAKGKLHFGEHKCPLNGTCPEHEELVKEVKGIKTCTSVISSQVAGLDGYVRGRLDRLTDYSGGGR